MRYFSYIAEQSFKSDNEGHRLFYLGYGNPFSWPYLIPDEATEARLFRKMTWYCRIYLPTLILGQSFLFPHFIGRPWLFLVCGALLIMLSWVVLRIVFNPDLRTLHRAPSRLSLQTFYTNMAQRHSEDDLSAGILVCISFVIGGILICSIGGPMLGIGALTIVFFGACAAGWGYALHLKQ